MTAPLTANLPAVPALPVPALPVPAAPAAPAVPTAPAVPHSRVDDLTGLATGALVTAFGLFTLKAAGVATGGTAGVSLLVAYASGLPLGLLFFLINAPFFILSVPMKGWAFTLRSLATVAVVSGLASVNEWLLGGFTIEPFYGSLIGNLLAGVGLLIIFRHGSSTGGFGVLALIAQERLGWRAGYVGLALDAVVVACSFVLMSPIMVLASFIGAAAMNLTVALNHRPGRYTGR